MQLHRREDLFPSPVFLDRQMEMSGCPNLNLRPPNADAKGGLHGQAGGKLRWGVGSANCRLLTTPNKQAANYSGAVIWLYSYRGTIGK